MAKTLTAAVHQEEDWYVARCLEVEVASQGQTIDEAKANLIEAVQLYLEEAGEDAVEESPFISAFQIGAA
ncbi:type II toxin-antitoxin system HicB family antitoxin [Sciscionella sediminilitoris]|uniref:type II toxin-antitoxin system HicB family antitoxin n=1 Tax=Sciscionella sediminilitoris TaxID=1445613 RepID=UPI0004DF80D7|nr:hypothetical protein [Sciscionella sp. SE31]